MTRNHQRLAANRNERLQRDDEAIDMAATLLPLADNVPGLAIEMAMLWQG